MAVPTDSFHLTMARPLAPMIKNIENKAAVITAVALAK
jgi:hypothetical protein